MDGAEVVGQTRAVVNLIGGPAPRPCDSCPYRTDVPAGVWHADEYAKLAAYDAPTGDQPRKVFLCHQPGRRVCAGWAGCHDGANLLALRLAEMQGAMTTEALSGCSVRLSDGVSGGRWLLARLSGCG